MPWSFLLEGDKVFLTMNGKKVFDYNGGDLGPIEKADYGRNQDEIWVRQSFCFNLLSSFCQTCGAARKSPFTKDRLYRRQACPGKFWKVMGRRKGEGELSVCEI